MDCKILTNCTGLTNNNLRFFSVLVIPNSCLINESLVIF